ncbi:HAMP domain-containing sensor histidine kinase [Gryllotalpicola sp.]|uniref:sensor histidine kinase n=1 Tax=Gryllotalpicola sp. TaxID=1932787 RepID=UPI002613090E|nr:HAMP domain-containing sensor histidine kinase [Gryllotalpicola sp.]
MHRSIAAAWAAISLRTKVTGVTVMLLTFGLLLSGLGTMLLFRPVLLQQLDEQLQAASAPANINAVFDSAQAHAAIIDDDGTRTDYFMVRYDAQGALGATNWTAAAAATQPVVPKTMTVAQGKDCAAGGPFTIANASGTVQYRALCKVVTYASTSQQGTVIVAVSTEQINSAIASYLSIFLGFSVIVVVVGAVLTRMLVTAAFAPLREVERTAAAIADGDYSQRLGGAEPNTEVGRLNRSLNTMLGRIDRAFRDRARTIEQMRRFVGDASHELRTPLVTVRGYAELYRMGALSTPEEVTQAMGRIEKEAVRMGLLVEDLLELARLDEARPLDLARVDLLPLAHDAALDAGAANPDRTFRVVASIQGGGTGVRTLAAPPRPAPIDGATGPIALAGSALARLRRGRSRRSQVVLTETVPLHLDDIPTPQTLPAIVLGEENKLRQVLANLIANAVRYTPAGSPIEIGVTVDLVGRRALLDVIDHGEGIPPQIREKIFQRFWRADTSRTRETGGSGLGLAIVNSIVRAHRGSVAVLDTPGGGATFRVALPLAG